MEGYPYEETFKDRRSAACRRNGHADVYCLFRRWRQRRHTEGRSIRKQLGTKSEAVKLCDNDGKVKNDSKLYKETAELLDARIKAETSAFGILLVDFDVKGVNPAEPYVTVTLSADYKTAGLVAGFVNLITEKLGKIDATNSNVKLDTEWAKAAVVVRTNEKGSYAAIAIQVKNLNYPKT